MLPEQEMDYQIADDQRAAAPVAAAEFRRSLAFPEGLSSHTKIAVPDPIEANNMKIAAPEQPPGLKVACPDEKRTRVATPPGLSTTGDFRRPIKLSSGGSQARQSVGLKLYNGSVNPVRNRR